MRLFLTGLVLFTAAAQAGEVRVRFEKSSVMTLPLEEYLRGVVPHEMPATWPNEALKAQAVAARSFAYRRILERPSREYDVDASVVDQQFKFSAPSKKIDRVLEATRDMVLVNGSNEIFETYYHADCGGITESAANVWGGESLSPSKPDCEHETRHWTVKLSRKDLVKRLVSHFKLPEESQLKSLQTVGHSASGRVEYLRADFTSGAWRIFSSQEFRRLIGFERVPSTNFQLRWSGSTLLMTGSGQGHGVGLCQRGARAMAEQGKSFRDILAFYYPTARLINVHDLKKPIALVARHSPRRTQIGADCVQALTKPRRTPRFSSKLSL